MKQMEEAGIEMPRGLSAGGDLPWSCANASKARVADFNQGNVKMISAFLTKLCAR